LTDFAALIELELDFVEEDVEFARREDLIALLDSVSNECIRMRSTFRYGQAVREGIPLVLVGAPNAGKSTLLNRLLRDDRALVSDIPGTTRDSVEERFRLGDLMFRLIDTAGIRETDEVVERMGIERSWAKIREAHMVLALVDPLHSNESEAQDLERRVRDANPDADVVVLLTKRDTWNGLDVSDYPEHLAMSPDPNDLDALERHLESKVRVPEGDVLIANARHAEALGLCIDSLARARESLVLSTSGELVAYDLRDALRHLGSITGEVTADDLHGSIFGRFCIGK